MLTSTEGQLAHKSLGPSQYLNINKAILPLEKARNLTRESRFVPADFFLNTTLS